MFRCLIAVGAFALAATSIGSAAEPAPLRTLTYNVDYSVSSTVQTRSTGMGNQAGESSRAGFDTHGSSASDKGTLRVDVIAATPDLGLVVDASFDGRDTKQRPVRVAIFPDGRLTYDPKTTLIAPVAELLPLLSRGLVAEPAAPGQAWTRPILLPATGTSTYRVTASADDVATISVTTDLSVKGSYDSHIDATLQYAVKMAAPVKWDALIRTRRHGISGAETSDGHITATLATDTFKKPS